MSDREIWMLVFLVWLFGSITLSCAADKLERYIKNRRPRSAKRKAAQTKTIHINYKRKAG